MTDHVDPTPELKAQRAARIDQVKRTFLDIIRQSGQPGADEMKEVVITDDALLEMFDTIPLDAAEPEWSSFIEEFKHGTFGPADVDEIPPEHLALIEERMKKVRREIGAPALRSRSTLEVWTIIDGRHIDYGNGTREDDAFGEPMPCACGVVHPELRLAVIPDWVTAKIPDADARPTHAGQCPVTGADFVCQLGH